MGEKPLYQLELVFQGGDHVKAAHPVGQSSAGDVMNVQIRYRGNDDLALTVIHRVVK